MEITTLIGFVAALAAILFGISFGSDGIDFGNLMNFFDPTSLFIVIGGTIFVLLASFPLKYFLNIPKHFKAIIKKGSGNSLEYVEIITELSREARKKGLLALEDKANAFEDQFLKESVLLIVDAIEPEKLKLWFAQKLEYIEKRNDDERSFYDSGAALAPAFGMLGTLIGLINMLKSMNLEGGAESLGSDMSVALITTFYGSFLANVFFTPMSTHLAIAQQRELLLKEMIIEGVISIKEGENPKYIQEKLMNFLDPKEISGGEGGKKKKGKGDGGGGDE
ncbi:MAG: MotA/TolQ/ExbB proton channel family protein [Clostridia bacterium]|nr:MotA/TolQ/ExbB proton channel family protein [Clostridia bacterium]